MSKSVLILSGANGLYNLGDDAMFDVIAGFFIANNYDIITDGKFGYRSPIAKKTLPFMHKVIDIPVFEQITNWINLVRYFLSEAIILDPTTFKYSKVIRDVDLVVFAGMGAMNDTFASHGIFGRGIIVNLAKKFNKPVVIVGNGIGPINNNLNRSIVKRYINYVRRIFVRDEGASKECLVSLGYPPNQIEEAIDDAFFVKCESADIGFAKNLLDKLGVANKFICINIHKWQGLPYEELASAITKIALKYPEFDYVLLPNFFSKTSDDRVVLSKLQNKLWSAGIRNAFLVDEPITPPQSKALLSLAAMSIATRYHIGVFSLSVGTPTILVSLDDYYDQKMNGALSWYDLTDFALNKTQIEQLEPKVGEILTNLDRYSNAISENNKIYKQEEYGAAKYIQQLI